MRTNNNMMSFNNTINTLQNKMNTFKTQWTTKTTYLGYNLASHTRKATPPTYTLNLHTTFTLNLNLTSTLFKPRFPTPKALRTELEDYIYNLPMYQIFNLKKKDLVVCELGISNYIPWHLSILLGIILNDTWSILVWEPAENWVNAWLQFGTHPTLVT